jgi:hypothetical protein
MRDFFRDSLVTNYEPLAERMTNDPKDRHVLAAPLLATRTCLVAFYLKHFPPQSVRAHGVTVIGPSMFLKQLVADRAAVAERLCDRAKAIDVSIAYCATDSITPSGELALSMATFSA